MMDGHIFRGTKGPGDMLPGGSEERPPVDTIQKGLKTHKLKAKPPPLFCRTTHRAVICRPGRNKKPIITSGRGARRCCRRTSTTIRRGRIFSRRDRGKSYLRRETGLYLPGQTKSPRNHLGRTSKSPTLGILYGEHASNYNRKNPALAEVRTLKTWGRSIVIDAGATADVQQEHVLDHVGNYDAHANNFVIGRREAGGVGAGLPLLKPQVPQDEFLYHPNSPRGKSRRYTTLKSEYRP